MPSHHEATAARHAGTGALTFVIVASLAVPWRQQLLGAVGARSLEPLYPHLVGSVAILALCYQALFVATSPQLAIEENVHPVYPGSLSYADVDHARETGRVFLVLWGMVLAYVGAKAWVGG